MIIIIAAYVLTEVATAGIKKRIVQWSSKSNSKQAIIVFGNLNARIRDGSYETNPQIIDKIIYHDETNDNGRRTITMCQQTNLRQMQFHFSQSIRSQWAYKHPHKSKSKWVNQLKTAEDTILLN